ncbi:MAG: HAD family hydrolase [Bacteroidales bacterium]|nr:HAD family hydrolase [Bacteroidales bacterium]MDD3161720.1 HAD family hydrolase [Bacteroidales bacterium]
MKRYKGAIFDLDGTLVDTLQDIADAMNYVLEQRELPLFDYERYKYFVGKGLRMLVDQVVPPATDQETAEQIYREMIDRYRNRLVEKSVLYDGIAELLDLLVERKIQLSVLSNKADELVQPIVRQLMSQWPLAFVYGLKETLPRKPDPTSALLICKQMGLLPSEVIYLGDTNVDMETACKAGFFSVGVTWGFRTEEELRKAGAMEIIHHPSQLVQLL